MSAGAKLAGFAAVLALLFAGAVGLGEAIDRDGRDPSPRAPAGHGAGGARHASTSPPAGAHPVRGLAVEQDGLRLVAPDPELRRGRSERVRFRVVDERGDTVRDFDVAHEKRMHLIVARRDLTGFQHLHPEQAPDGSWSVAVRLDEAGSYRLFADFSHAGEPRTLATDLRVDGPADLDPLPAAAPSAVSDGGYDVRLDSGAVRPGREAELRFTITRDGGAPVRTDPYLGAGGHLVALREGDLAFLHVHPEEHGDDEAVGFAATFPTEGRYRLFLQFEHEGRVQTVAFTQGVTR